MTIAASSGRIPYSGNGVTTAFATDFKLSDTSHVEVTLTDSAGINTIQTITTHYTVVLGSSTATINMVTPPATGEILTLRLTVPLTQTYDLVNGQAFNADTIETALDLGIQIDQSLQEQIDRSIKVPVSASTADLDALSADLTTVADNITDINTVAGDSASITVVSADTAAINTVSTNISDVTTVSSNIADVNTVAGDSAEIVALSAITAAISTVATNVVDVTNFSDVYIGASASEPTVRNDSSALQQGDLYFDSTLIALKYYSGSSWISVSPDINVVLDTTPQLGGDLDVNGKNITGTVKLNGITYPSTDGTSGQVLNTDGAGTLSWASSSNTLRSYGAVGDGVTDDSAAIETAFNAANGGTLDGEGLTYRIDTPFTCTAENAKYTNMIIDASNIPDIAGSPDPVFKWVGTQGTATNLSANTLKGSATVTVASTSSFSADQYAYIESTALYDTVNNVVLGQIVRIKSVDSSTVLTLYEEVLYDFNTSVTAKISALTPKENITVENIKFIGSNANNQSAFSFDKCLNVRVVGCDITYAYYSGVILARCINSSVSNTSIKYARAVGLSYGVVVTKGCSGIRVINCYGEDIRHFVTLGGTAGVNLYAVVNGNNVFAREAGIDGHPASDYMEISNNTLHCAKASESTSVGIVYQGLNATISNNVIVGAEDIGIHCQRLPIIGTSSYTITGNIIKNNVASTGTGIYVVGQSGAGQLNSGIVISGNVIDGIFAQGIYVYAVSDKVDNVMVVNNTFTKTQTSTGIFIRSTSTTYNLDKAIVSGNSVKCSGSVGIYFFGSSLSTSNCVATGNIIDGSTFGIRLVQVAGFRDSNNTILNYTDPYEVGTSSTGVLLDVDSYPSITITGATFVVEEHKNNLICNRSSTVTLTLRNAAQFEGTVINVKTIQAQTVVSNTSNVVPIGTATAGTAILPATDGAWAKLRSDGTNWIIIQKG